MLAGTSVTLKPGTKHKALRLRAMSSESVLVLPNAWDAGSAAVVEAAGAPAIATTSGGISWSLGYGDGQWIGRDAMMEAARRIVAAVEVPVTVDIEAGYGSCPSDVAETVRAVIETGAVGLNLEDSLEVGGPLFSIADQTARLSAARCAAIEAGLPELVINARIDVYLFGIGDPDGRLEETLTRAAAYAEAGADGIFVPGLLDLDMLHVLCARSPLPVNAMMVPGGPSVTELASAGVRRVSVGSGLAQSAYTAARDAALELLVDGTHGAHDGSLRFGDLNALFQR